MNLGHVKISLQSLEKAGWKAFIHNGSMFRLRPPATEKKLRKEIAEINDGICQCCPITAIATKKTKEIFNIEESTMNAAVSIGIYDPLIDIIIEAADEELTSLQKHIDFYKKELAEGSTNEFIKERIPQLEKSIELRKWLFKTFHKKVI